MCISVEDCACWPLIGLNFPEQQKIRLENSSPGLLQALLCCPLGPVCCVNNYLLLSLSAFHFLSLFVVRPLKGFLPQMKQANPDCSGRKVKEPERTWWAQGSIHDKTAAPLCLKPEAMILDGFLWWSGRMDSVLSRKWCLTFKPQKIATVPLFKVQKRWSVRSATVCTTWGAAGQRCWSAATVSVPNVSSRSWTWESCPLMLWFVHSAAASPHCRETLWAACQMTATWYQHWLYKWGIRGTPTTTQQQSFSSILDTWLPWGVLAHPWFTIHLYPPLPRPHTLPSVIHLTL